MARSLPSDVRSEALKYGASLPKYDVGETGDQASARGQVAPEIDLQALLALSQMTAGQRARLERRAANQAAHLRRQAARNELARAVREERRQANRRAFASRKR